MSIATRKFVQMAQKYCANRPLKKSICVCKILGFTMKYWAFFGNSYKVHSNCLNFFAQFQLKNCKHKLASNRHHWLELKF